MQYETNKDVDVLQDTSVLQLQQSDSVKTQRRKPTVAAINRLRDVF